VKKFLVPVKLILCQTVKYAKIILLVSALACVGLLMGEKSLVHKKKLDEKRLLLHRENEILASEIQSLERSVTLLRSDSNTIEKVAKRKLGMARPDEMVYIFDNPASRDSREVDKEVGLGIGDNIP